MVIDTEWSRAQQTEKQFWGKCLNTFGEETKQFLYLSRMGFRTYHDGNSPFAFEGSWKSFIDIGAGPSSVLLKFNDLGPSVVVDPLEYPDWVYERYRLAGLEVWKRPGEHLNETQGHFDVALIYNCLQHTRDPELIIHNAFKMANEVHIFEWINLPAHDGHPHELTQANLELWTGRRGSVERLHGQNECYGEAWFI